jgi:hypothetical protein
MQASTPSCSEYSFAACRFAKDFTIIRTNKEAKEMSVVLEVDRSQEIEQDYLHNNLKISPQIDQ